MRARPHFQPRESKPYGLKFFQLNYIIDEIVVDGMVTETNINEIVTVLKSMNDHASQQASS